MNSVGEFKYLALPDLWLKLYLPIHFMSSEFAKSLA